MRALSLCTRRGGILLPVLLAACALFGAHAQDAGVAPNSSEVGLSSQCEDAMEALGQYDFLSAFRAALEVAGMDADLVASPVPVTVFAPTNKGFANWADALDVPTENLMQSPQLLYNLLQLHISPEIIDPDTLPSDTDIPTFDFGTTIKFTKTSNGRAEETAFVTIGNVTARILSLDLGSNICQPIKLLAIDAVLAPEEFLSAQAEEEPVPATGFFGFSAFPGFGGAGGAGGGAAGAGGGPFSGLFGGSGGAGAAAPSGFTGFTAFGGFPGADGTGEGAAFPGFPAGAAGATGGAGFPGFPATGGTGGASGFAGLPAGFGGLLPATSTGGVAGADVGAAGTGASPAFGFGAFPGFGGTGGDVGGAGGAGAFRGFFPGFGAGGAGGAGGLPAAAGVSGAAPGGGAAGTGAMPAAGAAP